MSDSAGGVAWSELEHNYGDAADVPDLLRGCEDPDPDAAGKAFADLSNKLYHQGGWVCSAASAASAALPFLADLASGGAVHHRPGVVGLIGELAHEAVTADPEFVDPAWRPALDATRSRVLALLADPDPLVRREATALATDVRHPDSVEALRERWRVEDDRTTRYDLALALGAVHAREPVESVHADLVALLADDDLQSRVAAVHALAKSDPSIAARHVDVLVPAVRHPDAVLWRGSAWIGDALVRATGALLADDPVAALAFATGIGRDGDGDQRVATLKQVGQVLSDWRTSTDAIMPFLVDHLDDDVPEVRYLSTALLACLGPEAARHADRLADLVADSAPRASRVRTSVGDAAVWALARQGDPRCVPGLVERLSGGRLGFETRGVHRERHPAGLTMPGVHEVLIPLHEHADALLDAVASRIESAAAASRVESTRHDRVFAGNLCEVFAAWGPAAVDALPVLVDLLDKVDIAAKVAKAIGAMGPAGADAGHALRQRIAEPAAAWALWRTGADPDLGADALIRHVAEGRGHHTAVALLGDLGPRAAASADLLRELAGSTDDWTRVEAAFALWRVTGDPTVPVTVLSGLAEPLAAGDCLPVRIAALRHLAEIGEPTDRVTAIARAVADNPRRIAYFGGWRTFTEDEDVRTAAAKLLV